MGRYLLVLLAVGLFSCGEGGKDNETFVCDNTNEEHNKGIEDSDLLRILFLNRLLNDSLDLNVEVINEQVRLGLMYSDSEVGQQEQNYISMYNALEARIKEELTTISVNKSIDLVEKSAKLNNVRSIVNSINFYKTVDGISADARSSRLGLDSPKVLECISLNSKSISESIVEPYSAMLLLTQKEEIDFIEKVEGEITKGILDSKFNTNRELSDFIVTTVKNHLMEDLSIPLEYYEAMAEILGENESSLVTKRMKWTVEDRALVLSYLSHYLIPKLESRRHDYKMNDYLQELRELKSKSDLIISL